MLTNVCEPEFGRLYLDLAATGGLVVMHFGGGRVWVQSAGFGFTCVI